jgi:tetratricopeptide (TPR) repeat protein
MRRRPQFDPFADDDEEPPFFPRGRLLLPWVLWVFAMPVGVGLSATYVNIQNDRIEIQNDRIEGTRLQERYGVAVSADTLEATAYERATRELLAEGARKYRAGQPAEAVALLDRYLASELEDKDVAEARWYRGLAQFNLGSLAEAEADFSAVLERGAYPYAARGQVRALLGRREEALADYARSCDEDPSRAYPAIWIAGLGGGDERLRPFASGTQWISEVARYYMGRLSEEELLTRAKQTPNRDTELDQLCEAYGYVGLLAEREGELPKALENYSLCVETGVSNFIEYRWAKIRLEQEAMKGGPEKDD